VSPTNGERLVHALEHLNRTGEIFEPAFDPDFEYHTATDLPEPTVYRGIDAYRAMVQDWRDAFDALRAEVERVVEQGDLVVIGVSLTGRIHGSRDRLAMPESYLVTFRDGKVIELREYRTTEAALAAARAADWRATSL
jgi:ketosteroid isomerase-like protein